MKKIGQFTDDIVDNQPYNLYSCTLKEIKDVVIKNIETKTGQTFNPSDYDTDKGTERLIERIKEHNDYHDAVKVPSFYHNSFIVVQDLEGEALLMDGFTRLFIAHKNVPEDTHVFVKSYSKDMSSKSVMKLLINLNLWKTQVSDQMVFDRGFTLYVAMRIGFNISHQIDNVCKYFDRRLRIDYQYSVHVHLLEDLLFNNESVFDDIVLVAKLHADMKFNPSAFIEERKKKKNVCRFHETIPHAVPFYRIVGNLRIINITEKKNYTLNFEDVKKWISNCDELHQYAFDMSQAGNNTSVVSAIQKSKDLLWNKYVKPVIMQESEGQTEEEKKANFRKSVNKEKSKYRHVTKEDDLKQISVGSEVYQIIVQYPEIKVKKWIYLGEKVEEYQHTPIGAKKTITLKNITHAFTEDGVEFDLSFSRLIDNYKGVFVKK